jgi:hypothetical protein
VQVKNRILDTNVFTRYLLNYISSVLMMCDFLAGRELMRWTDSVTSLGSGTSSCYEEDCTVSYL